MAEPAAAPSALDHPLHGRAAALVLALMMALPWVAQALEQPFYIALVTRVLIFALAATSLNLVVGFGGMVSFGHAAFVGVGAYTAAALMDAGHTSALLALGTAMGMGAVAAGLIGAVCLRTQGVYFIMITLAFAQMLYYLMVSLPTWGGDDGLTLSGRFQTVLGPMLGLDLADDRVFYGLVLALTVGGVLAVHRLLNSPLGHALQAVRDNPTRMAALGFAVQRIRWGVWVFSGALSALAGALLAHQGGFVSPALMAWSQSGLLLVMVILGGVGRLYGGVVGAALFLLLEELFSAVTIHWQLGLGAVLLGVVLVAPHGVLGLRRGRA